MNSIIKLVALGLSFTLLACGKKKDNDTVSATDIDEVSISVETGVTALSGSMDDQNGGGFSKVKVSKPEMYAAYLLSETFPKAQAASCMRPVYQSCNAGVKQSDFTDCDIPGTFRTINGYARLTYSQNDCSMGASNDEVTRTYDFTISGPRGGNVRLFSSAQTDYRGNSISGGGKLTKTDSGWDVQVLGRNMVLSSKNKTLVNHSVRSLSPSHITGSLNRSNRLVDGGQLEVVHNLAKYTATYSPHNLQWSASCCYPVSGSIDVTYSGSISGTGSVTFNSCGYATVVKNGQTHDVEFTYCE